MADDTLNIILEARQNAEAALKSVSLDLEQIKDSAGRVAPAIQTANNAMSESGKSAGGLHSALSNVASIAGGFVIGGGLTQLPGLLTGLVKGAADDEAATQRLQAAIKNLGGDFDATLAKVNDAI